MLNEFVWSTNAYKEKMMSESKDEEILRLHRELAGEKLRADQGWQRAEAKAKECNELRNKLAAMTEQKPDEFGVYTEKKRKAIEDGKCPARDSMELCKRCRSYRTCQAISA